MVVCTRVADRHTPVERRKAGRGDILLEVPEGCVVCVLYILEAVEGIRCVLELPGLRSEC